MKKRKQSSGVGITQRQFADMIGVHHSYVSRLVREGKIPVNADGRINPREAEEARHRNTLAGRGQRRWARRHSRDVTVNLEDFDKIELPDLPLPDLRDLEYPRCLGCGGRFDPTQAARESDSPDPYRFCSFGCAFDVGRGKTREQIRRRIRREMREFGCSRKQVADDSIFDWVAG